jgi:DNA-binding SARP family transcriptional activator
VWPRPDGSADWRFLLVVAGPGYGKTTALRATSPVAGQRWVDPAVVAGLAQGASDVLDAIDAAAQDPADAGAAQDSAGADGRSASSRAGAWWLVLDDVPPMRPATARALLDRLLALPPTVGVALSARRPPGLSLARWQGRGEAVRLGPDDLRLSVRQTEVVLRDRYDRDDPEVAAAIREATLGWPALVRLAADSLPRLGSGSTQGEGDAQRLTRPGTVLSEYVDDEILASLSPAAARLVRDVAGLEPLSEKLCATLAPKDRGLDELIATGVVEAGERGSLRMVPVVAEVARRALSPARLRSRARLAADFYAEHGSPLSAARAYADAGDPTHCARLLADRGAEIVAGGGAEGLIALAGQLPADAQTPAVRLQWADALRATGDVASALAMFEELVLAAPDPLALDPALAWRVGLAHYLNTDARAAITVLERADLISTVEGSTDQVHVLAWTSTAYYMLGEEAATIRYAKQALWLARLGEDGSALAAAHVAAAMARKLVGDADGANEHFALAQRAATTAGDKVQLIRILTNLSHEHLDRARYPQALVAAEQALALADTGGPIGMRIVAMCNRAAALSRLGRFDDAVAQFRRVIPMSQRLGVRRTAGALAGLGDTYRRQGWTQQARGAYEEAARLARETGERQALVPALTGLAQIRRDDDVSVASELAAEAANLGQGGWAGLANLAQGWVALSAGFPDRAAEHAAVAAAHARNRREPAGLAEAMELAAAAADDPEVVRASLAEAHAIWHDAEASVHADRVLATLGTLTGASTETRAAAAVARHRQTAAGVQQAATTVPLSVSTAAGREVRIQVLGRFDVRVDGQSVPAAAWQSRKARDLVRILVARRGRVVPREELAELLWPGEDVPRTAHRLSVLLSIVRTVLDPDRSRPDPLVLADRTGVALDSAGVRVDVDDFLADVAYGVRLYERGDAAGARSILIAAQQSYVGEPFEDEPYPDWTAAMREQARSAHLRAHRILAYVARAAHDPDEATSHLLAILEHDPYDEDAHRTLIAVLSGAGRHGEAMRARQRYHGALAAIGVPLPAAESATLH